MLSMQVRSAVRSTVAPPLRKELLRKLRRAMKAAAVPDALVSLTLSDNEELHELNRTYADEDHPTDVLSFAQQDAEPDFLPPSAAQDPLLPKLPEMLGDIIISVEIAQKQALGQGHDLLTELVHLSVHGLCHLLGMDHRDQDEERWMFGYEAQLRKEAHGKGRVSVCAMPPRPLLSQQEQHSG